MDRLVVLIWGGIVVSSFNNGWMCRLDYFFVVCIIYNLGSFTCNVIWSIGINKRLLVKMRIPYSLYDLIIVGVFYPCNDFIQKSLIERFYFFICMYSYESNWIKFVINWCYGRLSHTLSTGGTMFLSHKVSASWAWCHSIGFQWVKPWVWCLRLIPSWFFSRWNHGFALASLVLTPLPTLSVSCQKTNFPTLYHSHHEY